MITFAPESIISNRADNAQSVFAIDMDGDGDLDVLSASSSDNKVAWYENDGNQNFTPKIISTTAEKVDSVFAVDVDKDGDTDVISAFSESDQDRIVWYENDGEQNFTEQMIFAGNDNSVGNPSILVVDLDRDSNPDVISSLDDWVESDKIVWFQNDSTGNFTESNLFTMTDYYQNISSILFATDIDSDSDTDLLSVFFEPYYYPDDFYSSPGYYGNYNGYYYDYYSSRITLLENDGNQNFSEQTLFNFSELEDITSIFATDLDADNDTDILGTKDYTNQITWYDNDGNQNYSERAIFTSIGADYIFPIDFDADGDTDVVSYKNGEDSYFNIIGKIGIYENDGDVNFTESILSTNAHNITSIFPADVDGDGDTDILCSSAEDDKISWYENLAIDESDDSNDPETTDNFLIGTTDNDNLEGTENSDILMGLKGKDNLNGKGGNDLLLGGQDHDTLLGGEGSDFLNGNPGDDQLFGNANNDSLIGEEGEDILQGGQGEDLLDGGLGNDFLFGGLGGDQFVLRPGEGTDMILDYLDGTDSFLLDGLTFNNLTISSGIGEVIISQGNEVLALVIGGESSNFNQEDFTTL